MSDLDDDYNQDKIKSKSSSQNITISKVLISKNTMPTAPIKINFILDMINDFYYDLYSIKNLPKRYWVLPIIGIACIVMFFSSIDSLVIIRDSSSGNIISTDKKSSIEELIPSLYGVVAIIVFIATRHLNEKTIIKNVEKKYKVKLDNIHHARYFWLLKKFGSETDFLKLAKDLSEWKTLREKYSEFFQYDFRKTVYNNNAKPRVIALMIAFISVCTLLIINISNVSYDEVIDQLAINITYIAVFSPFIIIYFLILAFVITLLWRVVLMVLDSFISKKIVSNIRFGFLIEFLTSYGTLSKDSKKYQKF